MIFLLYEFLQFCKLLGFSQKQITRGIKIQNMDQEFSVYFEEKSLSFEKINDTKYTNPYIREN